VHIQNAQLIPATVLSELIYILKWVLAYLCVTEADTTACTTLCRSACSCLCRPSQYSRPTGSSLSPETSRSVSSVRAGHGDAARV